MYVCIYRCMCVQWSKAPSVSSTLTCYGPYFENQKEFVSFLFSVNLQVGICKITFGDESGSSLLEAVNSVRCKINAEFIAKPLYFAQILMTFCTVVNFFNCTGNNKKWSCQVQNVLQNSHHHPSYGILQNPCRM